MKKPVRVVVAAAVVFAAVAGAATIWAQRPGGPPRSSQYQSYSGNVRYDSKFAFIRMSYAFSGRQRAPWSHDYPDGEHNFMKLFTALANVSAHVDETSIMSFSDPEMFKFPLIYLCEPGYFAFAESDVTNLRNYLLKGGFMIVDDFPSWAWGPFEVQMSRVFPEGRWIELPDASHPIFHSFYEIESLSIVPMAYNLGDKPRFRALFEDNDPKKRMLAFANYQNDISEFWEWSAKGTYMVSDTNEAYKVGINEFIYGITH